MTLKIKMKTNLFTFVFGLLSILTFGQEKEIYLNDDLIEITQSEFNKVKDRYKYYNLKFDLDTLIANIQVQRVKKGQLSSEKLDSIRNELTTLSGQNISKDNLLIIIYYHGSDEYNSGGNKFYVRSAYKSFLRKLKKFENVSQFFMYKSPEGKEKYGKQLNWIKDQSGSIENTFLPIQYPCGSYVLIDKKGNFHVQKGEYNIEEIIDLIKHKEKTFANKERM